MKNELTKTLEKRLKDTQKELSECTTRLQQYDIEVTRLSAIIMNVDHNTDPKELAEASNLAPHYGTVIRNLEARIKELERKREVDSYSLQSELRKKPMPA